MDAFRFGLSLMFFFGFYFIPLPLTQANSELCQPGMVHVDHQCINVGNKVNLNFLSVDSVNRSLTVSPVGGATTIEVIGRGYTSHLGGSVSAPIPLRLKMAVQEELAKNNEKTLSQLGLCYQSAALSMSAKEKYLFQIELVSIGTSLTPSAITGGDGVFSVLMESVSSPSSTYTVRCGNSLRSQ